MGERHTRFTEAPNARKRGRAGVEQRLRRLAAEPLCRHCKARGIVTAATEVDHIQPLALGGLDVDDNCQSLCADHHAIKTAAEGAATGGAANHPDWMEPSAVPLTIVCGPPCSGKTTYIRDRAALSDTVIDLDTIIAGLSPGYVHWSGMLNAQLLNQGIRVRNAMLGALKRQRQGKAWFIVSAPTPAEREWWKAKLGADIVLLHPGADECKRRAIDRGTPKAIAGIAEWDRASRRPWIRQQRPPPMKVAAGQDGWPA